MSKRVHDCISCDGKTRHDNPPRCATCRMALRLQSLGPDEYPWGYYHYLARVRLGLEAE